MSQIPSLFLNKAIVDDAVPDWKRLDEAVRSWIVLSQHEKDQENYAKLQEQYK
jgi:hypothetical protein